MFLWWCGCVFAVVFLCVCVVVLLCFCGGAVMFLWWRGCVFVAALWYFAVVFLCVVARICWLTIFRVGGQLIRIDCNIFTR